MPITLIEYFKVILILIFTFLFPNIPEEKYNLCSSWC